MYEQWPRQGGGGGGGGWAFAALWFSIFVLHVSSAVGHRHDNSPTPL